MNRCIACWVAFSLALGGLAVGAPVIAGAGGSDDVFVDRFEVGVTGVLVDGVDRYFRRGGGIVVSAECDVAHQVTVEATVTGEDWAFAYDPLPDGFEPTADGFSYTPVCDDAPAATELTATNPALADFQDVLELAFAVLPRPPELLGLAYDGSGANDNPVSEGAFTSPLALVCGFDDSVTVSVRILAEADSYALANHPAWMSVSGDVISYDVPACDEGDFSVSADVVAHRDGLTDQASLTINATRPLIERLNVGGVDYFVVGDEFEPVTVACGEGTTGSYHTNVLDGWSFEQTSQVPDGFTLNPDGTFAYTPSCAPGSPEQTQYGKEATKEGVTLDSIISNFVITGVEQGTGPTIFGVDYTEDGQVNNFMLPTGDALELEVPYFCNSFSRNMRLVSDDPNNTNYTILQGGNHAIIDDTNRLRLFTSSSNYSDCDTPPTIDSNGNVITPNGLENTVVIQATNPSGTTTFSVDTRAYSPMISHVYVEPAPTSGGTPRPPYVAQFDSNKFSEMINLPCDRVSGIPHKKTLKPVISHDDVALMRPTRSYTYESNNQPYWVDLDMFAGITYASPGLPLTCQDNGFLFPLPQYTIKVGGTQGPFGYNLNITVTDD